MADAKAIEDLARMMCFTAGQVPDQLVYPCSSAGEPPPRIAVPGRLVLEAPRPDQVHPLWRYYEGLARAVIEGGGDAVATRAV